jgi:hypothetical protein
MKTKEDARSSASSRRWFIAWVGATLGVSNLALSLRATLDRVPKRGGAAFIDAFADQAPVLAQRLAAVLSPATALRLKDELGAKLAVLGDSAESDGIHIKTREWIRTDFLTDKTVTCEGVLLAETEAAVLLASTTRDL